MLCKHYFHSPSHSASDWCLLCMRSSVNTCRIKLNFIPPRWTGKCLLNQNLENVLYIQRWVLEINDSPNEYKLTGACISSSSVSEYKQQCIFIIFIWRYQENRRYSGLIVLPSVSKDRKSTFIKERQIESEWEKDKLITGERDREYVSPAQWILWLPLPLSH